MTFPGRPTGFACSLRPNLASSLATNCLLPIGRPVRVQSLSLESIFSSSFVASHSPQFEVSGGRGSGSRTITGSSRLPQCAAALLHG
jgi:hypothetical protein